ncbi:MAG: pyridoxal 5'-phosphate synthase glutaminase subunit PdxT [Marinifilaceae bacterium]
METKYNSIDSFSIILFHVDTIMKIGILSFQGAVIEHIRHIEQLGHEAVEVKYIEQLSELDGIILPGGESTTIGKLLNRTGMMEPLRARIQEGMPVWGTCAGMILLAKEIENDEIVHLGTMDIKVRRNAYGTQLDSFDTLCTVPEVSDQPLPLVFIRAPFIVDVKDNVTTLCEVNGDVVAARQDNMLATSFHPELTDNGEWHRCFVNMCAKKV